MKKKKSIKFLTEDGADLGLNCKGGLLGFCDPKREKCRTFLLKIMILY